MTTATAALACAKAAINHPDPQLRPLFEAIYRPNLPDLQLAAALERLEAARGELERIMPARPRAGVR